jgi:ribonuclease HII
MRQLHEQHPQYGWNVNKGYGTRVHREGIQIHGLSPYHRRSFRMGIDLTGDLFAEKELIADTLEQSAVAL